jgi:CBS domain-containing protein
LAKWECYRCNYVFEGDSPPEECPSCHYSLTFWLEHFEQKPPSVKDFVRPSVLKIDVNLSAWEAAKIMRERDATSIVVTVNEQPAGIVTEKDILYKVAAEDLPASLVMLKKIMSSPIITISSDAPLTDAIKLMAKHHIRRVLVTQDGKPLGMLSQRSIIGGSFRAALSEEERKAPD